MADFDSTALDNSGEETPSSSSSTPIPTNLWQSKFIALDFLKQGLHLDTISRESPIPLAFAQEGLWFLDQLQPENPVYNESAAFKITGALNLEALEQSLETIQQRHEALRTAFVLTGGRPAQVVRGSQPFSLAIADASDSRDPDDRISEFLLAEARKPFDLARGNVWRCTLLKLKDDEHILSIVIHHIITDRWSEGLMLQELSDLYSAFASGQESPLPELALQYAEFATWQRQQMQGDRLKSQLDYWKQQLGGNVPVLQLPSDRPHPLKPTYRGAKHPLKFSSTLTEAFKALGQEVDATLYMTLLAAFQTLLLRYTKQEDITVGTPVAGRNRPELESVMGYFVNTIVLRTQLHGNPSFQGLLERVRTSALGAFAYENMPFEQLVEELHPNREAGHNPLFQVMFALQNTPKPHLELAGTEVTRLHFDNGAAKFDLTLELEETAEGLQGYFEYNTDLFDAATIERMAANFQVLLEGIAANPERPILDLPLLSEPERQQVLIEWNPTLSDRAQDQTYHQLFEAQVQRTPDAIAVKHQQQQLAYRELNAKANQLAHHLRSLGIGPDTFVGICLERSVEMAIAVLGIFKAGGAYLPLDPSYPQERLEYMLADSQAPVLLTQDRLLKSLPNNDAQVLRLDTDWEAIAKESEANPENSVTPENLAYIIYTSGSTGKPKGVMIPHRGLVSHNLATVELFELTERDIALQFASISFDIAVEELFPTWLSGATLVFRAQEQVPSIEEFLRFVEAEQLTILNLPTAFWHEVVKGMEASQYVLPKSVRLVIVGGEKASKSLYEKWQQMVGGQCRWLNSYGPTETTVTATSYDSEAASENHRALSEVPIGRPLSNTTLYILDEQLKPVPVGVPGELHIGGAGVARGYLNRSELTVERFISDPFSDDPAAKLYKTGDLVRYLKDGHVEFLGRIDFQVKIRGFRIELGEIEAALEKHPQVQEAVVTAREDQPGNKALVAYLMAKPDEAAPTTSQLRSFLKEGLPGYMVPSAFVCLDAFPMTPGGKVDRRSLPAPEIDRNASSEEFVAPRDETESKLQNTWEKVLGIDKISVTENFFDLGGHSLIAVRLFAEIEREFGKKLPLAMLFDTPTIEQLSDRLRPDNQEATWDSLVTIKEGGSGLPIFLVHDADGETILYRTLAYHLDSEHPVYALRPYGREGYPLLQTRISEMVDYYIDKIRSIQPHGPYIIGGFCTGGFLAEEMARKLQSQGEAIAAVVLMDTTYWGTPFKQTESEERLSRLSESLAGGVQLKPHEKLAYLLKTVTSKAKNLLVYELVTKPDSALYKFKVKLLRSCLDFKLPLPAFVRNIPVRTIYILAEDEYGAQEPFNGEVMLFLSTAGEGNEKPALEIYDDPLLGWGPKATQGVKIYQIPGGHSSMLQDPNVKVMAEHLQAYINAATQTGETQESVLV